LSLKVKIRFKAYTTRDLHFVSRDFNNSLTCRISCIIENLISGREDNCILLWGNLVNFPSWLWSQYPKKNVIFTSKRMEAKSHRRGLHPLRDFKTFSRFQSLLIQRKPYFDLLGNSSKKLKSGNLDFVWGHFNSFPWISSIQWENISFTKSEKLPGDWHFPSKNKWDLLRFLKLNSPRGASKGFLWFIISREEKTSMSLQVSIRHLTFVANFMVIQNQSKTLEIKHTCPQTFIWQQILCSRVLFGSFD
jgi:hypothetical protein